MHGDGRQTSVDDIGRDDADRDDALLTAAMALAGRRLAILTGAGISTDSGIPSQREVCT